MSRNKKNTQTNIRLKKKLLHERFLISLIPLMMLSIPQKTYETREIMVNRAQKPNKAKVCDYPFRWVSKMYTRKEVVIFFVFKHICIF